VKKLELVLKFKNQAWV